MRISDWSSDVCSSDLDRLAVGQEAVIGAILIHDREPLGTVALGAGFRDIDDAAVEIGAFTRQAGIDLIGQFVCREAPVGGGDDDALPRQFVQRSPDEPYDADRKDPTRGGRGTSVAVAV